MRRLNAFWISLVFSVSILWGRRLSVEYKAVSSLAVMGLFPESSLPKEGDFVSHL